jgi:hypothetical protein
MPPRACGHSGQGNAGTHGHAGTEHDSRGCRNDQCRMTERELALNPSANKGSRWGARWQPAGFVLNHASALRDLVIWSPRPAENEVPHEEKGGERYDAPLKRRRQSDGDTFE